MYQIWNIAKYGGEGLINLLVCHGYSPCSKIQIKFEGNLKYKEGQKKFMRKMRIIEMVCREIFDKWNLF